MAGQQEVLDTYAQEAQKVVAEHSGWVSESVAIGVEWCKDWLYCLK